MTAPQHTPTYSEVPTGFAPDFMLHPSSFRLSQNGPPR